ncbi:hypothetical protein GQF03_16725 [Sneathiella chungangensis]|uniref:O-antigen ligase domain-containing protein n=1 Tax=Sneathiella chungangensis TaxID=1418234 RepID=A0A845MJQ6_9PROT|nr:O-antigen ligase family protein [Sneathiella chungangensis]MZR23981.1 hypothetical protein [Sneathiella chungangensis]
MVGVTAFVTVFFGIMALWVRPGAAVGILVFSMLIWPEYLRVPLGPADMSAPRLIALALLVRFVAQGRNIRINICSVDYLVFFLWLWYVLSTFLGGAGFDKTTEMIGYGFDTVLMYFVARLGIRSMQDVGSMVFPLFAISAVMLVMGWQEGIMTSSPYTGLDAYKTWSWIPKAPEFRLGIMRAKVSTSVHIFFGMAMMLIAGIAWALRSNPRKKKMCTITIILAIGAGLSSMSSGPWLAIITLIICNLYVLRPSMIKPTLYSLVALAIFLELASNRHFYHLIDYLALSSGNAWYRTKLLEVAVAQWRDYWLVGTGGTDINYWGGLLDGRQHIDLVNHFVVVAVQGGIPALLMYVFSHVNAVRYGIKARKKSMDPYRRKLIFYLTSALIAVDVSSMSVGLFGPPLLLTNILLGMLTSAGVAWNEVPVKARPGTAPRPIPQEQAGAVSNPPGLSKS